MKYYRCVICNKDVAKCDAAPLYNVQTIRHFCKSHVDDYQDHHRYFIDKETDELVRGYTREELRAIEEAKLSPEELKAKRDRERRDAQAAMQALNTWIYKPNPGLVGLAQWLSKI